MTALVLGAGAFIAVDRADRVMIARLRVAQANGLDLRTNSMVVAQVWRNDRGSQVGVARLLGAVDVRSVAEADGRAAGVLLAKSRTSDAVDATVALLARSGDRIVTSDAKDIKELVSHSGKHVVIVDCR